MVEAVPVVLVKEMELVAVLEPLTEVLVAVMEAVVLLVMLPATG